MTRLGNITAVVKHTSTMPAPVVLGTAPSTWATVPPPRNPGRCSVRFEQRGPMVGTRPFLIQSEYTINDGTGRVIVGHAAGGNKYSNISTETGKTILRKGNTIRFQLTVIMYFSSRQSRSFRGRMPIL